MKGCGVSEPSQMYTYYGQPATLIDESGMEPVFLLPETSYTSVKPKKSKSKGNRSKASMTDILTLANQSLDAMDYSLNGYTYELMASNMQLMGGIFLVGVVGACVCGYWAYYNHKKAARQRTVLLLQDRLAAIRRHSTD